MVMDAGIMVRLTSAQKEELKRLGGGNISKGFQVMFAIYEKAGKFTVVAAHVRSDPTPAKKPIVGGYIGKRR